MKGSIVYITEKSGAEAAERVETKMTFQQRKFPIYLCQRNMLLGNTAACVYVQMCVCVCVLGHHRAGSNGVSSIDEKPEPQLPNVTLMNSFMQFSVHGD